MTELKKRIHDDINGLDYIYELLRFLFSLPGAREKEAELTEARREQIISGNL